MMAASMAPEEVAGLRELFSAADVNDDGTISVLELRDIMQKPSYAGIGEESSILASVEKLNALLNEADVDGSGNLDLEEFIAATVRTALLRCSTSTVLDLVVLRPQTSATPRRRAGTVRGRAICDTGRPSKQPARVRSPEIPRGRRSPGREHPTTPGAHEQVVQGGEAARHL